MKKALLIFTLLIMTACDNKKESPSEKTINNLQKEIVSENKPIKKVTLISVEYLKKLLSKKTDTTYIINFWATWCKPCINELPYFEDITTKYASRKAKVILVSIDFPKLLDSRVIPFVEEQRIKSDVYLVNNPNVNSWMKTIEKTWTGTIPVTIIYNQSYRRYFEKSFSFEELDLVLKSLLSE